MTVARRGSGLGDAEPTGRLALVLAAVVLVVAVVLEAGPALVDEQAAATPGTAGATPEATSGPEMLPTGEVDA